MTVTLWHNPKCGTSRKVLDQLRADGIEPVLIEYLKARPDRAAFAALLDRLGVPPAQLVRNRPDLAERNAVLDALADDPALLQRPILETPKGSVIARPPERAKGVL